jgi:hypothetical protein
MEAELIAGVTDHLLSIGVALFQVEVLTSCHLEWGQWQVFVKCIVYYSVYLEHFFVTGAPGSSDLAVGGGVVCDCGGTVAVVDVVSAGAAVDVAAVPVRAWDSNTRIKPKRLCLLYSLFALYIL